jgi:hypothetical protein
MRIVAVLAKQESSLFNAWRARRVFSIAKKGTGRKARSAERIDEALRA